MALTKILIAVKTYPSLSSKYDELVCTAGFLENGDWIRIFPIPFRKLEYDKRYSKYDWVEIDLTKNVGDFRPESYKPRSIENAFSVVGHIETHNNWQQRKDFVLKKVYTNLTQLIAEAKDKKIATSLNRFGMMGVSSPQWHGDSPANRADCSEIGGFVGRASSSRVVCL